MRTKLCNATQTNQRRVWRMGRGLNGKRRGLTRKGAAPKKERLPRS